MFSQENTKYLQIKKSADLQYVVNKLKKFDSVAYYAIKATLLFQVHLKQESNTFPDVQMLDEICI